MITKQWIYTVSVQEENYWSLFNGLKLTIETGYGNWTQLTFLHMKHSAKSTSTRSFKNAKRLTASSRFYDDSTMFNFLE